MTTTWNGARKSASQDLVVSYLYRVSCDTLVCALFHRFFLVLPAKHAFLGLNDTKWGSAPPGLGCLGECEGGCFLVYEHNYNVFQHTALSTRSSSVTLSLNGGSHHSLHHPMSCHQKTGIKLALDIAQVSLCKDLVG